MKIFCSKEEHALLEMVFSMFGFQASTRFEKSGFHSVYEMGETKLIILGMWNDEVSEAKTSRGLNESP